MELRFFCKNEKCTYSEPEPFEIKLNMDAVMDEKNIADLFCPHCEEPLTRKTLESSNNNS